MQRNILILTTISGFLPKFLMRDVHILQKMGYTIHYASNFRNPIYTCNREELEQKGIVCHDIRIAKSPVSVIDNWKAMTALNRIIRDNEIEAVLCHNPMGGFLGRLVTFRFPRLYVIYTAHGFHFYEGAPKKNWLLFYGIEKFLARRTDQLITINKEDKLRADTFHLRRANHTAMVPGMGLDLELFQPVSMEKREEIREKLEIKKEEFLFLSVGELNQNKNHETIIRAFAKAKLPCTKLLICGEGVLHNHLEELILKLGLEKRVFLCGYQTKIEDYYHVADCFLFPSIREGLGMASLEAMGCGLPLIVGDNRGTREYAVAGENAYVCDATNVDEFSVSMEKVMLNSKRTKEMGARSEELAKAFSQEHVENILHRIYERMSIELEQNTKG